MITFLLMSMSTAAVSRCCWSWVRFRIWMMGLVFWLLADVVMLLCWWLGDECADIIDFRLSMGITDTEFASRWSLCDLLSKEVTIAEEADVFVAADGLDIMVTVCVCADVGCWLIGCFCKWKCWMLLPLFRSSVRAAAAVCSEAFRHDGVNNSSKLADVWESTSYKKRKKY